MLASVSNIWQKLNKIVENLNWQFDTKLQNKRWTKKVQKSFQIHTGWYYFYVSWILVTSSSRRTKITKDFDEKFEMCDSKWPIRQVPKIVKEAEKRKKHPPSTRENTPPQKYLQNRRAVPSPSEDVPATSRSRRMAQELKNSEVGIFYMCHLAYQRLVDTVTWCFLSLLYRICGFCIYLVMFDPYFRYSPNSLF